MTNQNFSRSLVKTPFYRPNSLVMANLMASMSLPCSTMLETARASPMQMPQLAPWLSVKQLSRLLW